MLQNLRYSLAGRNIVVFDLETKEPCGTPEVPWDRHDLMGISVGVAFHYATMEYRVFMDDNLHELGALVMDADIVSGFNIDAFDLPLLRETLKKQGDEFAIAPSRVYDMLFESRKAAGWKPNMKFPSGMRLDDHLLGTFGQDSMKTESGADAPGMYKRGELGRLASYCVADVKREAALFEHIWGGSAVNTKAHGWRKLRHPLTAAEAVTA